MYVFKMCPFTALMYVENYYYPLTYKYEQKPNVFPPTAIVYANPILHILKNIPHLSAAVGKKI